MCLFTIFLRKRCNESKKWRWLIQWMIWSLRHLSEEFECRILKYLMRGPLQHWTTSSIIPISKGRISLEEQKAQKQDRFFHGRQMAYLIYEYFQVTGANDSVENYTDLFTIVLRNDDIQEFDSNWDGFLLSMTKIPPDDIVEGLYKLRIRESEKLKTVLEWYDLETHQKKLWPDYHRLKTMVKRSIEQDIQIKNFWRQKWKFWEKRRGQESRDKTACTEEFLETCCQWEFNGQSSRGDICSFRQDVNKRAKMTQPNPCPNSFVQQNERKASRTLVPAVECIDGLARIISKELATTYSVKSGTLQNSCSTRPRVVAGLVKSARMHTVRLMINLVKGPKRMMTRVQ